MQPTGVIRVEGQRIEFRLEAAGGSRAVAVILHGGHMSAACELGEELFRDVGLGVLVVSRPGYGRTDPHAGPAVPQFVARLHEVFRRLEIRPEVAVGISLGARSAMTLAAGHPAVQRVVLMCPTSFRPWPSPRTRRVATVVFNPAAERLTWGVVHRMLRRSPESLPRLITSLSTLDGREAVRRLGSDRERARRFLLSCRSGRGFMIDLRRPAPDVSAEVTQPTLLLATRNDAAVAYEHATHLAASLPSARLVEVDAPSHLLWLGDASDVVRRAVHTFLRGPAPPGPDSPTMGGTSRSPAPPGPDSPTMGGTSRSPAPPGPDSPTSGGLPRTRPSALDP